MKYALFLGCMIPLRYPGIEASTKAVMKKLKIKFQTIKKTSCCPAPGVTKPLNKKLWLTIGGRNLSLAEKTADKLITMCNGCFETLSAVNKILQTENDLKKEVDGILLTHGNRYDGKVSVCHFIDVLYEDIGVNEIEKKVKKPLNGIRVAPFYGCHYFKVHGIKDSKKLEDLISITGANSVDYAGKKICCGAGMGMRSAVHDLSLELTSQKFQGIVDADADCVVDICPFCHYQLDQGQVEIEKIYGKRYNIPILNYSQLLGLSVGVSSEILGLDLQAAPTEKLLEKIK